MSRDGIDVMQDKCSEQGAVLILVKVKSSDKIFGGYNLIGWISRYEFISPKDRISFRRSVTNL